VGGKTEAAGPAGLSGADAEALGPGHDEDDVETLPPPDLLPAGPLAAISVRPGALRLLPGTARELRVRGLDASGRPIGSAIVFEARPRVAALVIVEPAASEDGRFRVTAAAALGTTAVDIEARSGSSHAACSVAVAIVEDLGRGRSDEGIPEPEFVEQLGARWRSRMEGERWQVNTGHPDYREVAERPKLKLSYLSMLFAKEVVLRSNQDPRFEGPLEQLVEVAAYAERRMSPTAAGRASRGGARARQPAGLDPTRE
jgi:hypothetical protein